MPKQYTNKKTGEAVTMPNKKPKSAWDADDRVPPFMPVNWHDWLSDPHVRQMNETMQGVFFLLLLEQWQTGRLRCDHSALTKVIRAKDSRNVATFMERWGHLFSCCDCAGSVQYSRKGHAEVTQVSCDDCADLTPCSCKGGSRYMLSEKLKNYSIDVKNGVSLGTTKPNLIKPNQNKSNLLSPVSPSANDDDKDEQIRCPECGTVAGLEGKLGSRMLDEDKCRHRLGCDDCDRTFEGIDAFAAHECGELTAEEMEFLTIEGDDELA